MLERLSYDLKKIDLLGKHFIFQEDDSTTFKTSVGGLLSIVILTIVLVIGFLFGQEVYLRQNPITNASTDFIENSSYSLQDFPLMFKILTNFSDIKQIIRVSYTSANLDEYENRINATIKSNSLVECRFVKFNKFQDEVNELIKGSNRTIYCLNFTQGNETDYIIRNSYGNSNSKFASLSFTKCRNTNTTTCDPNIDDYYRRDLRFKVLYFDSMLNSKNYSKPINNYLQSFTLPTSLTMNRNAYFSFTSNILTSDNGWILEDLSSKNYISFSGIRQEVDIKSDASGPFLTIFIDSPNFILSTYRSYLKVQELFAKIGGLFNAAYLFLKILIYFYLEFKFTFFMFDNLSDSEKNEVKKKISTSLYEYQVLKKEIENKILIENSKNEVNIKEVSSEAIIKTTSKLSIIKPSMINMQSIPYVNKVEDSGNNLINFEEDVSLVEYPENSYVSYLLSKVFCRKESMIKYEIILNRIKEQIRFTRIAG